MARGGISCSQTSAILHSTRISRIQRSSSNTHNLGTRKMGKLDRHHISLLSSPTSRGTTLDSPGTHFRPRPQESQYNKPEYPHISRSSISCNNWFATFIISDLENYKYIRMIRRHACMFLSIFYDPIRRI